ncbi:MAG: acetylornithine deacetylase, partial [Thermoanaerobaculia bacterium]|nr:acetylornithine deacetylase [Thermoanaerobaculia bacterium]
MPRAPQPPGRHRRLAAALSALLVALAGGAPGHAEPPTGEALRAAVARAAPRAFDLYRDLLRYPNDALQPERMPALIGWLRAELETRGFTTAELPTGRIPLVLAERSVPGSDATVLVYLQADGQPVDPSAWDQESPWEPVLKERAEGGVWRPIPWSRLRGERDPEWRIFARSAADSKGPIAQFLTALDL